MVNGTATDTIERHERSPEGRRSAAEHAASLGVANLNPFGDLHTLQHLSARLARSFRAAFEPVLRTSLRTWAEPLVVQRFADYSAERDGRLTAWLPLAMSPGDCRALAVFDGGFVIETLDLFFGGLGERPRSLPTEFTPATEAMIGQLGQMIAEPLGRAWEPLARVAFRPTSPEASPAMLGIDGDDAMIVTRFALHADGREPAFIDLVYPVAALKPFAPSLTGKVLGRSAAPEPKWRAGLTRAAMNVRFPVRSVLAEPVIPLAMLMELKVGDVIPVSFGADVPVMVGRDRLGTGTVGTSNGKAAIRITQLDRIDEEDDQ